MSGSTVWDTPLDDQSDGEAVNTILYRLAVALRYAPEFVEGVNPQYATIANVDPDKLLKEAEQVIESWSEMFWGNGR